MACAVPVAVGAEDADKASHGLNKWVCGGEASIGAEGLSLDAMASPAWASPFIWSGLKNYQITAQLRVDEPGATGAVSIKLGRTWAIGAEGPSVVFDLPARTAALVGEWGKRIGVGSATIPVGRWVRIDVAYSYDAERLVARVDGETVLTARLPREPSEDYMRDFGRPAPLVGVGVAARACRVTVGGFEVIAGAPRRRIAVLGDSITQHGYWVLELERKLGERVTNLGVGGDSARMASERFDRDVLPLKPEILVFFLGTNDIGWGATADQLAAALGDMTQRAKAAGIRVVLCELLARRGYGVIPEYNRAIAALAAQEDVPLIQWFDATRDPTTNEMKPGFAPDGVHPVRLGGRAMVEAIDPAVFSR